MDEMGVRKLTLGVFTAIAPEVEVDDLDPDKPLRDQVDLDSMDWLSFLIGLHDRMHVDIPEADYSKLVSLNDLISYLALRVAK